MRIKHATLLNLRLDSQWTASQGELGRLWKLYLAGLTFGTSTSCLQGRKHASIGYQDPSRAA
jgi:hypothetical protein